MAKNKIVKTFTSDDTWICPAGVNSIKVTPKKYHFKVKTDGLATFIKDNYGIVYSCGTNTTGILGVGNTTGYSIPTAVLGSYDFVKIEHNQCAGGLLSNGALYTWGYDYRGDLGIGSSNVSVSSPTLVLGGLKFKDFHCAYYRTFGLTQNGTLYAWGTNTNGELGVGDVTHRSSPVAVVGGYTFSKVWGPQDSNGNTFALTTSGALYAWGKNYYGSLGVGDTSAKSSPTLVVGGLSFKKIVKNDSGTSGNAIGLTVDGDLYAWGRNNVGQLGVGDTTSRSSPTLVLGGLKFKDISGNLNSYHGLTIDGKIYSWGLNSSGELGVGDTGNKSSPVEAVGGYTYKKVFGGLRCFGLATDDNLYAWGDNTSGNLGVGDVTFRSSPTLVVGGYKFSDVAYSAGPLGISTSGILYGWGNNLGQLGIGDTNARSSPTLVSGSPILINYSDTLVQNFDVIPGTSYPISFGTIPTFNGNQLYNAPIEEVTLEYYA